MIVAASAFMLTFRLLHIVAGILWVGSVFLFVAFIAPSADDAGPSAQPLLTAVMKKRKLGKVIVGLAVTNVVAGWVLWLKNMTIYGSLEAWVTLRFGLVLTIGGVLATTAAIIGMTVVAPSMERLIDLGHEVTTSGQPPSTEQLQRIAHLRGRLQTSGRTVLALLLLAIVAMATARYW
jgi:uncharacterized membrane protein